MATLGGGAKSVSSTHTDLPPDELHFNLFSILMACVLFGLGENTLKIKSLAEKFYCLKSLNPKTLPPSLIETHTHP